MAKENEPFEVRDLRHKEKFVVDDKFLNGYGKYFGPTGIAVYVALCRIANKEQEAYPSQKSLAEKIGVGVTSINDWLGILDYFNIIRKERKGKKLTNRYYLLDKKHWKSLDKMASELSSGQISDLSSRQITIILRINHNYRQDKSIVRKHKERKHNIKDNININNLKKYHDLKANLLKGKEISPQLRTEIQEEVAAEIRPSGLKRYKQKYGKK